MSLHYTNKRIKDELYPKFVFSKSPLDGQFIEDHIVQMAVTFFLTGNEVNGTLYTRSREGVLCTNGEFHNPAKYDEEEFMRYFERVMEGANIPMMDEARMIAQVSTIIIYPAHSMRVVVRESLKRYKPVEVTHVLVETKEVKIEEPMQISISQPVKVDVEVKPTVVVIMTEEEQRDILSPYFSNLNKTKRRRHRVRLGAVCKKMLIENRDLVIEEEVIDTPTHLKRIFEVKLKRTQRWYDEILGRYEQYVYYSKRDGLRGTKRTRYRTEFTVARKLDAVPSEVTNL